MKRETRERVRQIADEVGEDHPDISTEGFLLEIASRANTEFAGGSFDVSDVANALEPDTRVSNKRTEEP